MIDGIRCWLWEQLLRFPPLGARHERRIVERRFGTELAVLSGDHRTANNHESIIHFSVNKSATQYVKSILRRCAEEEGLTHVGINDYAFHTDFPYLHHLTAREMEQYQHVFNPSGHLYSVYGGMVEGIDDFEDYLVVLMVRDPRDVLTSDYFSVAYSHPVPPGRNKVEAFMERRRLARQGSVDDYVLQQSDRVRCIYGRYLDHLVGRSNVYITTYEEMIDDFELWLDRLLEHCDLAISSELKRELLEEARRSRPEAEDVSRHMRQVTPGDHGRKLEAETVALLNDALGEVLAAFGYS